MKSKLRPLRSHQLKADFFTQLNQLESSGLDPSKSLDIIKDENKILAPYICEFKKQLKRGLLLSDSGYYAKVFSNFDRAIIHTGESSGHLAKVYSELAILYTKQAFYRKQIKSKLQIPIILFVLMLFIQPIPYLVSGAITIADYLSQTIGTIVEIILLVYLALHSVIWLRSLGLGQEIDSLQLKVPVVSTWLITRQVNNFFIFLGLLLGSGLSILESLPLARDTIKNEVLKAKFTRAIDSIKNGNTLAESLRHVSDIDEMTIQQIVIGEESGRLEQTIKHLSQLQSDSLATKDALIAEWVPRLIYIVIVIIIAYSIITYGNRISMPH